MDLSCHESDIPLPLSSTTFVLHDQSPLLHHPTNGPSIPPAPAAATTAEELGAAAGTIKKLGSGVKYRECLKNHAASIGGNAIDGCGEFMPSGEEGSLEALKCAACSCHRNFHRREIEGEVSSEIYPFYNHHHIKGRRIIGQKGVLISGSEAYGFSPATNNLVSRPSPHAMIMPLGALQTSESEEMEGFGGGFSRSMPTKKRFRTKFTAEQKEKMLEFAEKVGWRLQKQEDIMVQQFCQEIGVKRRVLKVWMHNNKHNLAKKIPLQLE